MNIINIDKPIGLIGPCKEVETMCENAKAYQHGAKLTHLILPLDSGSGRTTFVEYLTNMFKAHRVMSFTCSRDDYMEVSIDASSPLLIERAFKSIDDNADYANEFSGIVGLDISDVASHLGEKQLPVFLKNCKELCEHALVVLFVHSEPTKNEEILIKKLLETIDFVKRIEVEAYTNDDICSIIIKTVLNHGIEIEHESSFRSALSKIAYEYEITGIKDAMITANAIVQFADYSGIIPVAGKDVLKLIQSSWSPAERREAI